MKRFRRSEGGNIFTVLLGGIVLSGALSIALFQLMGGPVLSTVRLAKQTAAQAQTQTVARMVIADASGQANSDCDGDGYIEPKGFRAPSGTSTAPVGGGLLPLTIGAAVTDPWGTDYGYCVWDTGPLNSPAAVPACGANRLAGSPAPMGGKAASQAVVAVIAAGPDKTFQTTCSAYDTANPAADLLTTPPGSDDIVSRYTYSEASQATAALWTVKPGETMVAKIDKNISVGNGTTTGQVNASSLSTRGKIVAGGAAKLGDQNTVTVCDAGHAGLLRYNSSLGTVPAVIPAQTAKTSVALAGGSSASLSFPSMPKVGNTVVVVVSGVAASGPFALAASGITDNQGGAANSYTLAATQDTNASCKSSVKIFYRSVSNVTIGPFTVTITPTVSTKATFAVMELSGLVTAGALDQAAPAIAAATGATTATAPVTGATTQAAELAISAVGGRCSTEANVNYLPAAGWTATGALNNNTTAAPGLAVASKALSATGAVSNAWTFSAQPAYPDAAAIATFKATAGSATAGLEYCDGTNWAAVSGGSGGTGTSGGGADCLGLNAPAPCAAGLTDAKTEYANNFVLGLGSSALSAVNTGLSGTPITIVQTKTATGKVAADGATSISATFDALPVQNATPKHSVFVLVAVQNNTTAKTVSLSAPTDNQTGGVNTYAADANSSGTQACFGTNGLQEAVGIYRMHDVKVNAGTFTITETPTFAASSGGGRMEMTIVEVAGLDVTGTVDQVGTGTTAKNKTTTLARVSATTANDYDLVFSAMAHCNKVDNTSAPFTYNTVTPLSVPLNTNAVPGTDATQDWQTLSKQVNADTNHVGSAFVYRITTAKARFGFEFAHATTTNTTNDISPWAAAAYKGASASKPAYNTYYATATGYNALKALTGQNGTALGYNAGVLVTTGGDNTAAGANALDHATTGTANAGGNTAIGASALTGVTTGTYNTGIGASALAAATTAKQSVAIGYQAQLANTAATTGGYIPVAIGYQAMKAQNNGLNFPVAIGYQALANMNDTNPHLAIGYQAGLATTAAGENESFGYRAAATAMGCCSFAFGANAAKEVTGVAFGYNALSSIMGGVDMAFGANALALATNNMNDTAFGAGALGVASISSGVSANTAFGASALGAATTATGNTAFGYLAMGSLTTGVNNSAYGYMASANGNPTGSVAVGAFSLMNDSGAGNTAIGYQSMKMNTSGGFNTAIGFNALLSNTSASDNTAVGAFALMNNTTGSDNTGLGAYALYSNTQGGFNTAIGYQSLYSNDNVAGDYGVGNTALGYQALYANTSGDYNTAMGDSALYSNTTGSDNSAAGYQSMYRNQSGSQNTALGSFSLYSNTTGSQNSASGFRALYANTTGSSNTAVGAFALQANTTASYNTAVGGKALMSSVTDSYNTAIGYQALALSNKGGATTGNTAFGHNALYANVTGIGNTAFGANALVSNNSGGNAAGISVVQVSPVTAQTANSASASVTFASPPAAGNTIIVVLTAKNTADDGTDIAPFVQSGALISDNQGGGGLYNIGVINGAAGEMMNGIYYRSNISAPSGAFTVTVTPTVSTKMTLMAMEVAGLANTNVVDQTGTYSTNRGNAAVSLAVRVPIGTQDNELAVGAINDVVDTLANKNFAAAAGWTQDSVLQDNTTTVASSFVHKVISARAPLTHTWTFTTANGTGNGWETTEQAALVTFRGAPAGAAVAGGDYNTAYGDRALHNNTSGSYNTAFGEFALGNNTTGSYNTAYGSNAGPTTGALSNTTAIGYNATVSASNSVRIGGPAVTKILGQVLYSFPSDRRLKKDIADSDLALDFIMKLRPVSYRLISGGKDEKLSYGFIAQEVEQALEGRVTHMVMRENDPMQTYHLRAADLIAPAVRAIQQQEAVEEEQRAEIDALKARLAKVKAGLKALKEKKTGRAAP